MIGKYRLINYSCRECGLQVRILINKNGTLTFSILDKLHSSQQCLDDRGYYVCIECREIDKNLKFEYVYG